MKKSLLLALGLFAGMTAQAQLTESPWKSAEPADGTFYLYNVETGLWLQNNRRVQDQWTTHVQLDKHGFDFILTALPDGGFQLNPRFGHNHSLNGGEANWGYMDTGDPVTAWDFSPSLDGLGYEITHDNLNHYLNVTVDSLIDDFGEWGTWQLVTKEQRMADLETATKANPKDATWLIDDWDFANQNERNSSWIREINGSGSGIAFNQGWPGNRAVECWSSGHGEFYQLITGLPNGTYGMKLQGYYRDGSTTGVLAKREAGEEEIRAWYFANDVSAPFMSILDNGVEEEIPDVYSSTSGFFGPGDGGSALPRASNGFFLGYYWNPEIKVVVSDGTLRIGVRKESDVADDWLVFDNFQLTYYGSDIDIDEVRDNLLKTIDEAAAYEGNVLPVLAAAKETAETAKTSTDAKVIAQAATGLQQALAANKAMVAALAAAEKVVSEEWKPNFFTTAYATAQSASQGTEVADINAAAAELTNAVNDANGAILTRFFFLQTIPFAQKDGVAADIISSTSTTIDASESLGAMNSALDLLRTERKIMNADKHADVFKGAVPEGGEFYIYNVGLKRFLCGGGDWGAHAYVGFPGVEVTLIFDTAYPEGGEEYSGFHIDTHLNNGGENEYLNYGGYMDTPKGDLWEFMPVEGKEGVYNIARANKEANAEGQRMLLGYRPNTYGNIDTDMYGEDVAGNQWKLVTRAERDELLKTATNDNPQDASYKIACPNFNQREDDSAWLHETGVIFGRGGNNPDFAFEAWNTSSLDLSQIVYELEPGWYKLSVNGFYRDGDHENQIRVLATGGEARRDAEIFTEDGTTLKLLNISAEVDKAPGMGDRRAPRPLIQAVDEEGNPLFYEDGTEVMVEDETADPLYIGEFPYNIYQSCNFFQSGLYKNSMLVQVPASGDLLIGVSKERDDMPRDWVVVDNFRLTYYGTQKPDADAIEAVRDEVVKTRGESRIFNLQGVEMKGNLQRGLYIQDGQKVLVK
ncbi:MAG: hypothetical protein J6W75_05320 [Bacteroidaceae bacterium]|nr:hypothetical protein [Bacteroidaceae bacterium]